MRVRRFEESDDYRLVGAEAGRVRAAVFAPLDATPDEVREAVQPLPQIATAAEPVRADGGGGPYMTECAECHERVRASVAYCPWCGAAQGGDGS